MFLFTINRLYLAHFKPGSKTFQEMLGFVTLTFIKSELHRFYERVHFLKVSVSRFVSSANAKLSTQYLGYFSLNDFYARAACNGQNSKE